MRKLVYWTVHKYVRPNYYSNSIIRVCTGVYLLICCLISWSERQRKRARKLDLCHIVNNINIYDMTPAINIVLIGVCERTISRHTRTPNGRADTANGRAEVSAIPQAGQLWKPLERTAAKIYCKEVYQGNYRCHPLSEIPPKQGFPRYVEEAYSTRGQHENSETAFFCEPHVMPRTAEN